MRLDYKKSLFITASLHGGSLHVGTNFQANTNYLGLSAELGYYLNKYFNTYARYSFGRTGAVNSTLEDAERDFHLDATYSHRARLGARLKTTDFAINPYLGIAYEHEFKGETNGFLVLGETGVASPTMKGDTGVIELGLTRNFTKRLKANLRFEGTFGRRQGISGQLSLGYKL